MALPTLAEILTIPTQAETLEQEVFPELRTRGAKVTSWAVGGVYRALAYLIALMRVDVRKAIAAFAAAGFEDYVFGFSEVPGGLDVTAWAPLVAKQRYGLDRIEATHTKRTITLTNSTATPYGPVNAGGIILSFSSGNRYILDEDGVTIPGTGSVQAVFRSEFASDSANGISYNDPTGDTIVLVTANFPGVTATNPETTYSEVSQVGSGVGTLTLTGSPATDHSVSIRIDTTGNAGAAEWSYSLDGAAYVSAGNSASETDLGGVTGLNVALDDNSGSPAFAAGTIYYFTTPGSDIVQVGRDVETPQELGTRCRALLPLLAAQTYEDDGTAVPISPTRSGYELLARTASDEVKVCFVTEGTVNNEVLIYVAGQGALLSAATVAEIQSYIDSRSMLTDWPIVTAPDTTAITISSVTITVARGMLTTAQEAVQRALALYFGGVDANAPLTVNSLVEHAYVVSLIRRATGVKRVTDDTLEINGAVADLQLPVTPDAYEMATWSQDAAVDFSWVEE